ncbi:MAG: SAM-dependent methyltransferase [Verrucomicrobiia bacterium]
MQPPSKKPKPDPQALFGQRLAASLADDTFVRMALSPVTPHGEGLQRVLGRQVILRGAPHLSLTFRYATRDEVRNLPASEAPAWLAERLGSEFRTALLCTVESDWQLTVMEGQAPKLIRHKPSTTPVPSREHDQPHASILGESARDWLSGLGVTDASGKVRPGMSDKFAQINRYLEIFSHLAADAGWIGPNRRQPGADWTLVDMGCGKGFLTFGLWHLWRRVWGLPGRVLGVEVRPELVAKSNALAESISAADLRFLSGTIDSVALPAAHVLIALHACNTATDQAILRGIEMGAELIIVAPCCYKQLRPQLGRPAPLAPVLRHGLLAERMAEWATDGLRTLYLEWAGYRTKVLEFVPAEHTPKNLMIAAVRGAAQFADPAARARIEELKAFFAIKEHALDPLLGRGQNSP